MDGCFSIDKWNVGLDVGKPLIGSAFFAEESEENCDDTRATVWFVFVLIT